LANKEFSAAWESLVGSGYGEYWKTNDEGE
jgi:hypothetical protein